jgi:hypothetical protein
MANYNLASLPTTPVPVAGSISNQTRRDFQILRFLKSTKSANGARDGTKVYLANYRLKSPNDDPRLYARNHSTSDFHPNTCFFDTETGKGYCIISMATANAARSLMAAVMKDGTIERNIGVPVDLSQVARLSKAVNHQSQRSNFSDVVPHFSGEEEGDFLVLLKKCETLPKDAINTMLDLAGRIGTPCLKYMNEEYFKNFSKAMATNASIEKRIFHFRWCKFFIQLDKHQHATGKTDTEIWPVILTWQSEMDEAYKTRFGVEP